jgi:acyl-CoA reductase-like NAD-dependent aldehyde dehydrogenase
VSFDPSQHLRVSAARNGHEVYEAVSPVSGEILDRVPLWSARDIGGLLEESDSRLLDASADDVFAFLGRFREAISSSREELVQKTLLETGFVASDCWEMVDGAIEYLRDFETHVRGGHRAGRAVPHSYAVHGGREMQIAHRPYHTVAALVPQNAALPLSITIIASALYAGSRLLLRPSLQCAATGSLLSDLVSRSEPPEGSVTILNSLANEFLRAICDSAPIEMIHYIGSNRYAMDVFNQAFAARKICVLDGQGNGMLYVGEEYPVDSAVQLITAGATRYNGETCTSVNGVLVHARRFEEIREGVVAAFRSLHVGHPGEDGTHVGPLLSRRQAEELAALLSRGENRRVLCGGETDGAYFTPAVVEGVDAREAIVCEGFFGPAIWIHPVEEAALLPWLHANRFPLSDTVLSHSSDLICSVASRSRAARICINQDPSIESMFEPWGGYPSSGLNIVSDWVDKYRQPYQLDGAAHQLLALSAGSRVER